MPGANGAAGPEGARGSSGSTGPAAAASKWKLLPGHYSYSDAIGQCAKYSDGSELHWHLPSISVLENIMTSVQGREFVKLNKATEIIVSATTQVLPKEGSLVMAFDMTGFVPPNITTLADGLQALAVCVTDRPN